MTVFPYSLLLTNLQQAAESKQGYACLTERYIQALWLEQKYFKGLKTHQGDVIEIISPGLWNSEAGPDFLKAHLKIGSQELKGDIEIHLHDTGWYHHHHHQDERYNHVILHLSLWPSVTYRPFIKQNGQHIISACLQDSLTVPSARLIHLIDLDLYPYKKFVGSGRCAQSLFSRLPERHIEELFSSAAQWRLTQKKRYLQAYFPHVSYQAAGGLAMALGYKQNAEAFLNLFQFLLSYRDHPTDVILAIGLGCCGFFEDAYQQYWHASAYYHHLKLLWWEKKPSVTHQAQLKLHHIRPLNHPIRRLAYLARFLTDCQLDSFWTRIKEIGSLFLTLDLANKKQRKQLIEQILEQIPTYQDAYWNYHYTFETVSQHKQLSLIGQDLKKEILVNTLLPLLYADLQAEGDAKQIDLFQLIYQDLKASYTSKTRYLIHRFFGDGPKGTILEKAQMEQGAYQLHKDFCIHYEASCEGCPFVKRYQTLLSI